MVKCCMKTKETMEDPTDPVLGGAGESLMGADEWGQEGDGGKAMGGEKSTVQLPAEYLPPGHSCKPGDRLTFVVTGEAGKDGAVPGHFEYAESSSGDEEDQWAKDVRKEMSPMMSKESEAV